MIAGQDIIIVWAVYLKWDVSRMMLNIWLCAYIIYTVNCFVDNDY